MGEGWKREKRFVCWRREDVVLRVTEVGEE
jgi:hypothetical protein